MYIKDNIYNIYIYIYILSWNDHTVKTASGKPETEQVQWSPKVSVNPGHVSVPGGPRRLSSQRSSNTKYWMYNTGLQHRWAHPCVLISPGGFRLLVGKEVIWGWALKLTEKHKTLPTHSQGMGERVGRVEGATGVCWLNNTEAPPPTALKTHREHATGNDNI